MRRRLLTVLLTQRIRGHREMERHSITPEALHALMGSHSEVLVFDVRHSLDLLGDSVILPGAQWIAPKDVRANPSLLPKDSDLVVYCTCPSDKTSRIHLASGSGRGIPADQVFERRPRWMESEGFPGRAAREALSPLRE